MKLAEAAKATIITNVLGLTPIFCAMATAKGNTRAAAALLVTAAARRLVII